MKKFFIIAAAAILALSIVSCKNELKDVAEMKDVTLSVSGTGANDEILLLVENRQTSEIQFVIARGTVLKNGNSKGQNMVVARKYDIKVAAGEKKEVKIYAFCVDYHKDSPVSSDSFELTEYRKIDNSDVSRLLAHVEKSGYDIEGEEGRKTVQNAVWFLANGIDFEKYLNYSVDAIIMQSVPRILYAFIDKLDEEEQKSIAAMLTSPNPDFESIMKRITGDKDSLHAKIVSTVGENEYKQLVQGIRSNMPEAESERGKVNSLLAAAGISGSY